jgi:hypothetical protein
LAYPRSGARSGAQTGEDRMSRITAAALARWRRDPIAFIREALIDPETGQPFVLYPEQVAFLLTALTPTEDGRLPFAELLFSAPKKSGKTGLAAIVMLYVIIVLAGRFGEGYAVANDLDQAQGRVFAVLPDCRIRADAGERGDDHRPAYYFPGTRQFHRGHSKRLRRGRRQQLQYRRIR